MKLKPVSFQWKSFPEEGTKIGLIAQDLQEVIPEVVKDWEWEYLSEDRNNRVKKEVEVLGVYYSDLIPVLIKAIQEQNHLIEKLELRILELEKEKLHQKCHSSTLTTLFFKTSKIFSSDLQTIFP